MDRIVIIGGGGHAKVVISILKKLKRFEVFGYVDKNDKGALLGCRFLGNDNVLGEMLESQGVKTAAMGLGMLGDDAVRKDLSKRAEALGFEFPAVISPDARLNEEAVIGDGTVVMDGSVINSGTSVGKFCIINTNATIDHDCRIADNVHIAPGAVLCGGVEVGEGSLIGAGATVIQYRKIAQNVIIGAGAVITDDCDCPGTYVGVPAKLLVK